MNAARAVGSDDESEALLDKSAKSKKKKKKKDKKKKKKKNNDDDTTDDDDTAERTTDESNEESQEDSDRSLSSLEKFELLQKDRRSALNSSDPNMSRMRMSSSSIGRDSSTNLRAELARNRRASFAVNRGAPNPAELRRGGSTRSFHSDRRRSFHSHNDSFNSLGSSFASRGSRRTLNSDNMSTVSLRAGVSNLLKTYSYFDSRPVDLLFCLLDLAHVYHQLRWVAHVHHQLRRRAHPRDERHVHFELRR